MRSKLSERSLKNLECNSFRGSWCGGLQVQNVLKSSSCINLIVNCKVILQLNCLASVSQVLIFLGSGFFIFGGIQIPQNNSDQTSIGC